MRFDDFVAFFEAQGRSMADALALAELALRIEGEETDAP